MFMRSRTNKYNAKQIIKKLKITNSKDAVKHALIVLEQQGLIMHHKEGKYRYNRKASLDAQGKVAKSKTYEGRVDQTRSGDAYIICEGLDDDVFVRSRDLKGAFNKDIVKVAVPQIRGKRRPEGKVVEIVTRSLTHLIGKLSKKSKLSIVYPLNKKLVDEVYINNKNIGGASDGDQVVVKITEWGASQNKSLWGQVTEVLRDASDNDLAMQSILLSNGFDLDFPQDVLDQVKDGSIEVGIHIADVTHYVPEDSPLDKEALKRSTSVYLVDRVLPMLPEKLSNDLCSLNPHEDRYTFSAIFTFDTNYKITKRWYGRTVIHSDRRFTYEEAQEIIETGKGDYHKEINKLNKIAEKLRKDKYKNGAISFESDEVQFVLNEEGKPINTYVKQRKAAHMLVEDFMLLANKGASI